jgi:hypothetical protein
LVHYTLNLVRDRDLRVGFGEAARRRALGFSLPRMVAGTQAVYDAALGEANR